LVDPGENAHIPLAVNLANRLIFAFDVARDPAMLNEAVELIGTLLDRAMPDEWRAAALDNLGLALRARFELAGDREDLHASLKAQRKALEYTAAGAAERVNRLNNLANACRALYLSGVLADLDEAVDTYAAAAECPGRPVARAACLLGLGTARWDRWGRRQMPGDLDAAIVAFTSAVELVDEASPTAAHGALNLGAAYFARWRHLGRRTDLDLAIKQWAVVRGSPVAAHEITKAATTNLGGALWERYEVAGDIADLHQAIDLLGAVPDEAQVTLQPGRIFTLAGALRRRFDLLGDTDDRDRAVAAYRRACTIGMAMNPGVALSSGQSWGEWAARRGPMRRPTRRSPEPRPRR
jgi:tetratricopeptide (TPR) repeat protein